jgi:DNA-binding MarR family transcriptional regulator
MPVSETSPNASSGIDLACLDRMTGFLVRLAQLRIYEAFHTELGGRNITPARYSLLALLHDNPDSRPGQIAEALRVKPSNMASLLTQFEAEGLIVRLTDPAERRAALVRLSDAGETLFAEIDPVVRALEDKAVAMLEDAEKAELRRLLAAVAAGEGV